MQNIAVMLLVGATLMSCGPTAPERVERGSPYLLSVTEAALVRSAVSSSLKDPGSAQFGAVRAARTDDGIIHVCGTVNARNSFGAYTGPQPFSGALTSIPRLTPVFFPVSVGGSPSEQAATRAVCLERGVPI